MSKLSLNEIRDEFHSFIDDKESVILGTVNKDGEPEASYAPVLRINHRFYIYVSELSQHTGNLQNTPKASLLFIEDETSSKQIFARQRATLKAKAKLIERKSDLWEVVLDSFEEKFGGMIPMLRPLEDFHLFEFTSEEAGYVRGFAQAYRIAGEELSEVAHRNDRGHGRSRVET